MSRSPAPIVLVDDRLRYGVHVGKKRSLYASLEPMMNSPLFSFQIFVTSPRGGQTRFDAKDCERTRKLLKSHDRYLVIHGRYTCNCCGTKDPQDTDLESKIDLYSKEIAEQLDIGVALGDVGVIVHFGSCLDAKKGEQQMIELCTKALTRQSKHTQAAAKSLEISEKQLIARRRLILENCAGEGDKIGYTLKSVARVLKGITERTSANNVTVCIDTQHAFAAALFNANLVEDVERFLVEFDRRIGLDRLELFHLNDSKVPWGHRTDRHECLGLGYLFDPVDNGGLRTLLEFSMSRRIPLICETDSGIYDRAVLTNIVVPELEVAVGDTRGAMELVVFP